MKREETTLLQLKQDVDNLLNSRPDLADATVLIDTEARTFHAHMIDVTSIYAESNEGFEAMGRKWVTITPDYHGTTHSPMEEEIPEFDEERLTLGQLEILDIKINDLLNRHDEAEAEYVASQLRKILKT